MNIKYSIIVPIYNVEDYLLDCLESINSSMNELCECLLINDGSTDESALMAQKFCEQHSHFRLYHKDNGGLSDARNFGLSLAKGEYIIFVDSDDVVHCRLIEFLDYATRQRDVDIVYLLFSKFYKYPNTLFDNNDVVLNNIIGSISKETLAQEPNFAWARVVKKELYTNNLFPKGNIYEDVVTTPILTYRANTIIKINEPMYGYRKRANSITTGVAEKQFRMFESVNALEQRYHKGLLDKNLFASAAVNLIQSALVSLVRIKGYKKRSKYRKLIQEQYKRLTVNNILESYSYKKYKMLAILSRYKLSILLLESLLIPIVYIYDQKNRLDH
ncbi:hypothetical protein A4G18_07980 [Pasteurellaceae bacterium Pebbles2]|nr:hypothetical protein [Pasteurellaceae bacterium Pebbles2]